MDHQKRYDWQAVGALVCGILEEIYIEAPEVFRTAARQRGVRVEQLAAASITEAIRQSLQRAKRT